MFGGGHGGNIVEAFLLLKNPKEFNVKEKGIVLSESGYDGFIEGNIYGVFNSNQIKSATDNIGSYSENPDMRFSFADSVQEKPLPMDMPKDLDSPTFIEDIKEWAINNFDGKSVEMPDENGVLKNVVIDKRGIKESMNRLRKRVRKEKREIFLKTIPALTEILSKAKFKDKPANKHGQKLDVFKYESRFIDKGGVVYGVDITVKENLDGKFYYDHNLTKIETLGVLKNSEVNTAKKTRKTTTLFLKRLDLR